MGLRSEFGLLENGDGYPVRWKTSKGFGRVPVKMQKAIRASRERCLALSALDENHFPERVV